MKDATEAEQWLDNFNLYVQGPDINASNVEYHNSVAYYPACNDHFVPGELDKLLAKVRAEARREALRDAIDVADECREAIEALPCYWGATQEGAAVSKRDEPTWVYNKRWGWLVDECPLFAGGKHWLWVITGRYVGWSIHNGQMDVCGYEVGRKPGLLNAPFWDGWDMAGKSDSWFQPLTTAARDLLASLRSEMGTEEKP